MAKLEALIFDVDGTLADNERDGHRIAFNRAFAEAGLDWNWSVELYGELLVVAGGKERLLHFIDRYRPEIPQPGNILAFVAGLHAAKTRHYIRLLEEGSVPFRPGVKRLLEEAKDAGLRLAIATTTTPANVTALLDANLPGGSLFEVVGAGDIVPAKKPAPDVYRYVLQELRLGPQSALAIEDSAQGLQAALGAGVKTLITVNDYTAGQDFTGAALVLDKLGEPDAPFRVLSGEAGGANYANVSMLQELFARD
jgi:HAD superfamily hydrolase (TIGR01509 family)